MNLKHVLVSCMLVIPMCALAQSAGNMCLTDASAKKFWNDRYAAFVTHGNAALKDGDAEDAEQSLLAASRAAALTCQHSSSKAFETLRRGVAQIVVDKAMLDAVRKIATSDYMGARHLLEDIAQHALKNELRVPEGLPVLHRTASEAWWANYFASLDRFVAQKNMTAEELDRSEGTACREIRYEKLAPPERCKKYGSK